MKAVVTGAAGFIGSRLSAALLAQGHTVLGVDCLTDYYAEAEKESNLSSLLAHPAFTLARQDLVTADLDPLMAGKPVVFHLAGQPGVRGSWGTGFDLYLRNNIQLTQRLLEASRRNPVARFIYSSSSSVYGDSLMHPTSEQTIPRPRSPYGVTKLAAEHLVNSYALTWDLPAVSLRYFTVYGKGQRPDMAIERLIRSARGGGTFKMFGDGGQSRDFTHVSDVVRANLLAATMPVEPGDVFNIAGGSHATLLEVIGAVEAATGQTLVCEHLPQAAGDVRVTSGETERARDVLNWTPLVSLADGIAEQVGL
jgi:UDP-glucuronate 4-epimerase